MVKLRLKEILDEQNMSRYELQKRTGLNYPRVNQLYNNAAKNISLFEIDLLTNVLNCSITNLISKT